MTGDRDAIPTTVANDLTDGTVSADDAVTIRVRGTTAPTLPVTGHSAGTLVVGGGLALVLGTALVLLTRTRRRSFTGR